MLCFPQSDLIYRPIEDTLRSERRHRSYRKPRLPRDPGVCVGSGQVCISPQSLAHRKSSIKSCRVWFLGSLRRDGQRSKLHRTATTYEVTGRKSQVRWGPYLSRQVQVVQSFLRPACVHRSSSPGLREKSCCSPNPHHVTSLSPQRASSY